MVELFGEAIGTCILVLLGNGVVAGNILNKTKGENSGWLMITLGWGLAVTIAVYTSGIMGPAHLNPAVTIAMAALGQLAWSNVPGYIIAQMLGTMVASIFVWAHYYPHWEATEDADTILATFATGPAIRHTPSNVIGEVIGTAVLIMVDMALGPNNMASGFNPMVVGFVVTSVGLSLGGTTGYAINPARDLGPRIMHAILPIANKGDSDWSYAWIPIVGPILGAVVGALLYNMALALI